MSGRPSMSDVAYTDNADPRTIRIFAGFTDDEFFQIVNALQPV